MAKSLKSNLIEQHIEKIVLGVCLLLLVYVLTGWVLSSPREFAVPGAFGQNQTVKPEAIDTILADKAERLYNLMKDAKAPKLEEDTAMQELVSLQRMSPLRQPGAGFLSTHASPARIDWVPPRLPPPPGGVNTEEFASKLPAPAKPGKPQVALNRELPQIEPLNDQVTAHVAAVFNYGDWVNGWKVALRQSIITPTFYILAVHGEVRERSPNGEWSQPRPVKMTGYPLTTADGSTIRIPQDIPALPADLKTHMEAYLNPPAPAAGAAPAAASANASGTYVTQVFQNMMAWEPYILQPEYYNIWLPGHNWVSWRYHLPKVDAPAWDAPVGGAPDEAGPGGPPVAPPPGGAGVPRAPAMPAAPRVPGARVPAARTPYPDMMPPMMEGGPMPVQPRVPGARTPYPDMMPPMMEGGPMPVAPRVPGARVPAARAGGARAPYPDMMPPMMEGPAGRAPARGEQAAPTAEPLDEPQNIPDLQTQKATGQLVLWLHDASLANRKEYQFRVRLEVYNPLFCYPKECDKPEFADRMTLMTPFSEWSDKASVVQPVEFFLAGSNESQRMVKVTVFAQHMGQYVKADFNLAEGHRVGEIKKAEVMNPLTQEREKRDVEFQSGATAVEFRYNVPFTRRGFAQQTVEMVYVDQEGVLHTRSLVRDRDDPRRKKLEELVQAAAPEPVRRVAPPVRDRKAPPPRAPMPMMEGGPMDPMYEGGGRR